MQGIDNLNTERAEKLHDYTNGYYPEWIEYHEFQPVYAKLGKMITDRIPYKLGLKPITKYEPEYWMLAGLLTQEEAKLCLSFGGIRKPRTFAEIKKRSGIKDEKRLQKMLYDISWMGVLEYNWENEKREKQWLVPMFVPGSGEDAEGVATAVDFLREVGAKESYDIEGDVVVIGGGNVAVDVSRSAVRCGAPKVSQFSLETRDIMPASDEEIAEAEEDGVLITGGWGPKEILTEDGHVVGIIFKKCVTVYDENGRFDPKYDEEETITVPCRHVFLSVGQSIEWGSLLDGRKVELGRGRGIVVDPVTYQSAEPDIFAGGDVYTGPKFAIDAIAAGKEAAISIHRYVQPNTSLTIGRNPHVYRELDKDDISVTDYDHESRQIPAVNERYGKEPGFRDPKYVFTEEQVKKETSRCLVCGASVVDENQCIGCGVCTTKCEFDAIHLFRERPECTDYQKSEDKLKLILPYAAKQAIQIRKKEKAAKAAGKKA